MTTTIHRWFRSGDYLSLGHTELPEEIRGDKGVLIVPPFGFEEVSAYRSLRHMAGMLAANGIPVLRFDLPGTGDSSGGALDNRLLKAWVESISTAAEELRANSGVKEIVALGVQVGAMLALMAAADGADIEDLVLWGPAATGRNAIRELRAFAKMRRASQEEPLPQPIPGLEVAGFLLTSETQQALEAVNLTALSGVGSRRALLLTRDDLPPDTKLLNALRSWGCAVEVKAGAGYAAMMAPPLDSAPPVATGRLITEFVAGEFREEERPADFAKDSHSRPAAKTVSTTEIDGVVESVYTVGASAGRMFGVLSEPPANVPQTGLCILFLNAGAVRHIGPNRMWVEAARRWAARGVPSLRLDLLGIGESDGETHNDVAGLYEIGLVEQVESAMESLRARLGHQRFAAIGLCSGAFYAFHAAIRNPEIRAAVLLNPRLFFWDPEVDRRRMLRSTARGLTDWRHWRSLAQGRVRAALLKRVAEIALERMLSLWTAAGKHPQIEPTAMGRAWSALERNQCQMTMIFGGGEPLLAEMEAEGQLPPKKNPRIRCVRIPNTDHLVCPLWAQKLVHDLVDDEIDAAVHDGEPSAERRFSASGKT